MLAKILAILSIIVTAGGLMFATSIANFAGNQAITTVENGVKPLTDTVPNADKMIRAGNTDDDLNTLYEYAKNVRISWTKGISNTMTFRFLIMIVLAAVGDTYQKLR